MKKCPNCGAENNDVAVYCASCGATLAQPQDAQSSASSQVPNPAAQNQVPPSYQTQPGQYQTNPNFQPPSQNYYQQPPQMPYGQTANTTGYIVWSIINLLFCCMPLGIVGLIMSINAKNCFTKEDFESKIKSARIFNIIATVAGVVAILAYIIFVVILGEALDSSLYY